MKVDDTVELPALKLQRKVHLYQVAELISHMIPGAALKLAM